MLRILPLITHADACTCELANTLTRTRTHTTMPWNAINKALSSTTGRSSHLWSAILQKFTPGNRNPMQLVTCLTRGGRVFDSDNQWEEACRNYCLWWRPHSVQYHVCVLCVCAPSMTVFKRGLEETPFHVGLFVSDVIRLFLQWIWYHIIQPT